MTIGDKVRKIRESKEYSQEYMAAKLDITQPSYARIESGSTRLSTDRLEKIALILDVKPELIMYFGEGARSDHPAEFASSFHNPFHDNKAIEVLEHEVEDLREERNKLLNIIERFSISAIKVNQA